MPKTQKKFMAAPITLAQIAQLVGWRGQTQTEIFATAIDMLWQLENQRRNPPKCGDCGTPYSYYAGHHSYVQQCDCDDD